MGNKPLPEDTIKSAAAAEAGQIRKRSPRDIERTTTRHGEREKKGGTQSHRRPAARVVLLLHTYIHVGPVAVYIPPPNTRLAAIILLISRGANTHIVYKNARARLEYLTAVPVPSLRVHCERAFIVQSVRAALVSLSLQGRLALASTHTHTRVCVRYHTRRCNVPL